jgi:hypothetical protein
VTTNAIDGTPLTAVTIRHLVTDWYRALDLHVPLSDATSMLDDADLVMQFPEGEVRGHDGFAEWYDRVTRIFFDEQHVVKSVNVDFVSPSEAEVKVLVNWQAKVWHPPAPRSEWLGFDSAQTWRVRRRNGCGDPVIRRYVVDSLDPMTGSGSL